MILQLLIFAFLLIGVYYVKGRKKSLEKHRLFMGAAVLVNAVLILFIMGRAFLTYSSLAFGKFGFVTSIILVHGVTGGLAEILGIRLFLKHPRKIRMWMRIESALWFIALLTGITFYTYAYIL